MATNKQIDELFEVTRTAYSYSAYRSWRALCGFCLRQRFTMEESIEILRSKWPRWAGDGSPRKYGYYTSTDLKNFLNKQQPHLQENIRMLVAGY